MITVNGKKYNARTVDGFDSYNCYQAKIVSGVNTKSGEAAAILMDKKWKFINPSVK